MLHLLSPATADWAAFKAALTQANLPTSDLDGEAISATPRFQGLCLGSAAFMSRPVAAVTSTRKVSS